MLNNSTLIHFFSLNCQSNLEPILYQRLKEWVEQEDNHTFDNKEAIEEMIQENQPVSKDYLYIQEQLLKKVEGVTNSYSLLDVPGKLPCKLGASKLQRNSRELVLFVGEGSSVQGESHRCNVAAGVCYCSVQLVTIVQVISGDTYTCLASERTIETRKVLGTHTIRSVRIGTKST